MISLTLLLLAIRPVCAMEAYPIFPVHVTLRVEPDRVVADVEADSIYWIEEVLRVHPLPPSDWPEQALKSAENYTEAFLRLSADGARLKGRLTHAAYTQRPWQVNEQGRIFLRMVYPPIRPGARLSGEIDFYEDSRKELLEGLKGQPMPYADGYKTLLRAGSRRFELKPGAVAFEISDAEARPGPLERGLRAFAAGGRMLIAASAAWPALASLALFLAPNAPSRRRTSTGALALAAGLTTAAALPAPSNAAVWAAGAAAATAAGGWLGATASSGLAAAALAALGWSWGAQAVPWLPAAAPSAGLRAAAAAGTMASAAAALTIGWFAVQAERRRLTTVSESRAAGLFASRRRLAATTLLLVCGYGLSQYLPR